MTMVAAVAMREVMPTVVAAVCAWMTQIVEQSVKCVAWTAKTIVIVVVMIFIRMPCAMEEMELDRHAALVCVAVEDHLESRYDPVAP